ncbi:MAG: TetR/AcrR family transcriptional regulator [Acidobacteria bacterium]|nr:TetR/AcrR family transcriptional regulator [Acidobacteriota bacterium]
MILNDDRPRGKNRRHEERSFRRTLILRAAEHVFGRRPFHEATMQMVAAEAQLGMQGLYEHFPSKQALYEAVILHRARAFERRLTEALSDLDDPLEQLAAVARVRIEVFIEAPAFLPVFLAELIRFDWGVESRLSPEVHAVFRQVRDRVDAIIERAVAEGSVRPADSYFLQHVFMDVINAVLRTTSPDLVKEDIQRCVDLVMQTFLEGVGVSRS